MREGGYYWVKYQHDEDWSVAEWCFFLKSWSIAGSDAYLSDQDMTEIDERRIVRPA